VLDEISRRQAGVVTRQQARRCGLSDSAVRQRLVSGRWQRLYPGVFACFSGRVPRTVELWAAVLFGGPDAMLSHDTAAELHGLVPQPSDTVHISVPGRRRVTRYPGLVVHRSSHAQHARHPVLEPARTRVEDTIVDLTQTSPDLESAVGWMVRGVTSRQTTPVRLRAAIKARSRIRWRRNLVAALRNVADGCHSILELRYQRRVEQAHGLPPGVRQQRRDRWRDDVAYPLHHLTVELDGQLAHPAERAFRDHRRDNAAVLAGAAVLRYGYVDVTERACVVAREVAAALNAAGWAGRPRRCGPACGLRVAA
jgi:very-short-patch-repair endonuclease